MAKESERDGTRITIRVSTELREAIDEAAAGKEWSVAHWVSRAVEQAIDEWRKTTGSPPLARTVRRAPPATKTTTVTATKTTTVTTKRTKGAAPTKTEAKRDLGKLRKAVKHGLWYLREEFTQHELARHGGYKGIGELPGATEARKSLKTLDAALAKSEGRKPSRDDHGLIRNLQAWLDRTKPKPRGHGTR